MKFKSVEEITSALLPVADEMGIEIVEAQIDCHNDILWILFQLPPFLIISDATL